MEGRSTNRGSDRDDEGVLDENWLLNSMSMNKPESVMHIEIPHTDEEITI